MAGKSKALKTLERESYITLLALGYNSTQIAERFEIPEGEVCSAIRRLLQDPEFTTELAQFRAGLQEQITAKAVQGVELGIDFLMQRVLDEDEAKSVRMAAAKELVKIPGHFRKQDQQLEKIIQGPAIQVVVESGAMGMLSRELQGGRN